MKARVLVIDDDRSIRETFEQHLTDLGHVVETEGDPRRALKRMATFDPEIVISDVRMEGLDGIELTKRALKSRPDLDIVVITAFEDMDTAVAAMAAGAREYLVKPLDLDRVDAVIAACLRSRRARAAKAGVPGRPEAEPVDPEGGSTVGVGQMVGRDPAMIEVFKSIGALSRNRTTVLVRGETGTGKERVARAIHESSPSASQPFVAVNCAALSSSLLESELFGHVRGAFTGAVESRRGYFELAGTGTIFLDEIGDTGSDFQSKLLRVLQEREFYPVGGERALSTEARVIAATHRPLEGLVAEGQFREDLYFRLRVVEMVLPPLRDRRGDIREMAEHFIDRLRTRQELEAAGITEAALRRLESHDWPGNARELENVVARAAISARGGVIDVGDILFGTVSDPEAAAVDPGATLAEAESAHVQAALERHRGNKLRTARSLGISRPRLDRIIEKYGLTVPES